MSEHRTQRHTRRSFSLNRVGLLFAGCAVVGATAIAIRSAGGGLDNSNMPSAGSGMAPPHTTYQQPVVDPINLGGATTPDTPPPPVAEAPTDSAG